MANTDATYRVLQPDEYPQAVDLWVRVFGVEDRFFTSLIDGGAPDDSISLGAFVDGVIVASVHIYMRQIRDRGGKALKVGGIGNVSTDEAYRKQGHSGKLLELAIGEMEHAGCAWSYLGTGVNDHYARYGWATVSSPYINGTLTSEKTNETGKVVLPVEITNEVLEEMAKIYAKFTLYRPMAHVRSIQTWKTAIEYRLTRPGIEVFPFTGEAGFIGYLVTNRQGDRIHLTDAACHAGHEADLSNLIAQKLTDFRNDGMTKATYALPMGSFLRASFENACESHWLAEGRSWMVRPISDRISHAEVAAIHAEHSGRHCDLDNF